MSEWWPLILWLGVGAGFTLGVVAENIEQDGYSFDNKSAMVLIPICMLVIWPVMVITAIMEKCNVAARNRRERIGRHQREAALRAIVDEMSEYDDGFHHRPNYRTRRRAERSQGPW